MSHSYFSLSREEIDRETGCTVCEEDQEVVHIPPLQSFKICKKLAPLVRDVFERLVAEDATLYEVTGYRVGKTRGDPDDKGNRTGFSNHSYGAAIDINQWQNGLYDRCIVFGPECRLVRGGEWKPGKPGSHTDDGLVVKSMKRAGFKWGGKIAGKQKDFMHFSLTGY